MSKGARNDIGLTGMSVLSLQDARKVNAEREKLYAFFSRLFAREVDEEALGTVIAVQPAIHLLASSQETEELKDGSRLFEEFVAEAKTLEGKWRENLIRDLRAEYADLFLAVGKNQLFTSESAYLGRHPPIYYDKPFFLVGQVYKESGFKKRKDFLEPEDHIAVELDFMANLCKQTHLSLDESTQNALRYLKLQREFLRAHLLRWVPDLCKNMKVAAESKLYKALAYLTDGFVSMEEELVDELAKTLEAQSERRQVQ